MRTFVLINLASQIKEVREYTKGWASNVVISWLGNYGEVIKLENPYDDQLFIFNSFIGIKTGFRLTQNNDYLILGDNTIAKI